MLLLLSENYFVSCCVHCPIVFKFCWFQTIQNWWQIKDIIWYPYHFFPSNHSGATRHCKVRLLMLMVALWLLGWHAVPELVAKALAEPICHDHEQASGHQADQQHAQGGFLHYEQVDAHRKRAEIQQAQEPHQGPSRCLAQQGCAVPHCPSLCDRGHGIQAGGAVVSATGSQGPSLSVTRLGRGLHDGYDHVVGAAHRRG